MRSLEFELTRPLDYRVVSLGICCLCTIGNISRAEAQWYVMLKGERYCIRGYGSLIGSVHWDFVRQLLAGSSVGLSSPRSAHLYLRAWGPESQRVTVWLPWAGVGRWIWIRGFG